MRSLNLFEQAECLVDSAAKGNLNFSIVSTYTGKLDSKTVQMGLKHLQQMHPLLRMSPNIAEKITAFIETCPEVPFKEFHYEGKEQWKFVVKKELAPRFNKIDQPLWRVCLLKGENEGQLIVTFHHAIADGVCAMRMMNHLFQILAQLIKGQMPHIIEFNTPIPDIHSLYSLTSEEPMDDSPIALKEEKGLHQDFTTHIVEEEITKKIIEWSKSSKVKVHAILFAAFLMAVRYVLKPDFDKFNAITVVNYRSSFIPAFSNQVLTLMRTLISEEFAVSETSQLKALSQAINKSVHSQLDAGKHVLNLKVLEKRLSRNISPEELLQRCKLPAHAVAQTNLGAMEFSGDYPDSPLRLDELFFFADATPFFEEKTNLVLGTLSFRQKIFLCLWFLEELVGESEAKAILLKMKEILSTI
jgi:NRPS condensation-like uncharacterized protein